MNHLFEQLANPSEPLTEELRAQALAQREALLPSLAELLVDDHRPKQIRAIELVLLLQARELESELLDLLSHKSPKVRRPAIDAVGQLFRQHAPSADTVLVLEAQLGDETSRGIENAIMSALVGFPQRAGLPALIRVCGPCGEVFTRRVLLRIRQLLEGEPDKVWEEAMAGLSDYGREVVARCADFEPLKTLFKAAAGTAGTPHELEPYGKLLSAGEHPMEFPPELIESALERLSANGPRHLMVVGPPGVGKTAFLEEVCKTLLARGASVVRTTTTALLAGTKYLGEWQTRVQGLITQSSRPKDVVIFMEDLNNLPFAGTYTGSPASFASLMRPAMEDGTITVIGETTPDALATGLASKPDFRHLFAELKLEPPKGEKLRAQLQSVVERLAYEVGRDLILAEKPLEYLIELADRFIPGVAFPGKAVPILKGAAALAPDDDNLTSDLLVRSVAARTGLPVWLLEDQTPLDLVAAKAFFARHVVGQDDPVNSVVDLITLIKAGLSDPTRPLGVFLFVGPTGVGKTELAKSLAEFMFGSRDRLVRVDMSEFKDYDSYQRLIGSRGGGDQTEGLLTGKIKEQPFAVILLDEFEKAHPNVYDLMLGLFDDGRLTNGRGETINFCSTVIIMTSNLGQTASHDSSLGILARTTQNSDRDTMRAVEGYFSPEFINRIRVSMFGALDLTAMQSIARREMTEALARSGIARRGLLVDADDSVLNLLLKRGFTPRYGARPLKRAVEELFLLPIARQLVKGPGTPRVPEGPDELRNGFALGAGKARPTTSGLMQVRATDDGVSARYIGEKSIEFREARLPGGGTVQELEKRWSACSVQVVEQELEGEYQRLSEQAGAADFWEQAESRQIGTRLHRLESLLDSWRALGEQLAGFSGWLVSSAQIKGGENQRNAQAARRYQELNAALDIMELKLRCREPWSQQDAFLRIRPLGPQIAERDGLKTLLEMYRGWADRIGGEALVLNDPVDEAEPTLVLRVVGPQSYGLLRQEQGLHRLSLTKKERRQSALIKVDVISAAPPLPEPEVHHEGGAVRGAAGRYGERPRSWVGALHLETSTVAEGRNSLDLAENEQAVKEYLAALVAWGATPPAEARIVRSYYFEPDNEVLDVASGLRSRRMDSVLAGELEPFLLG